MGEIVKMKIQALLSKLDKTEENIKKGELLSKRKVRKQLPLLLEVHISLMKMEYVERLNYGFRNSSLTQLLLLVILDENQEVFN